MARVIFEQIILKWGLISEILSDLGPEFQAELSQELFQIPGINEIQSTAYRPQHKGPWKDGIRCYIQCWLK